jgi:hypothetical protein
VRFTVHGKVDLPVFFGFLNFLDGGLNLPDCHCFFLLGLVQLGFGAAQVGLSPFQFVTHGFPSLWRSALTAASLPIIT